MTTAGIDVTSCGATADGVTDNAPMFAAAVARLAGLRAATLRVPDGTFALGSSLRLPHHVSLVMEPATVLLALPGFDGRAVLIKGDEPKPSGDAHGHSGCIRGGAIDGNRQDLVGLEVHWARRFAIRDLEVLNARRKGVHVGVAGWYETRVNGLRCALDADVPHVPGSIGLHVDRCSDNHIDQVVIIGYETGVRATGSSTAFSQVHVWNWQQNRPLRCAFDCAGWQDSWFQCQADSPEEIGFRVTAPFQRFVGCWVQTCHGFSPGQAVGFKIEGNGTHGTYLGNFLSAAADTPMRAGFEGSLDAATIVGNTYTQHVQAGRENQLVSDTGGTSHIPALVLRGTALQTRPA